ncbi:Protein of unknown function [Pyronema omphalodes CBS 100304]|uniref:Uncharacterized protein n=1 Tax=Pyronema omphalodes (strain CBS 100304) TaxID=1076935 RepID=U4LFY3_PYROM|nr:Protein of unknown function [Pyronema omphalodes CBS 100304]
MPQPPLSFLLPHFRSQIASSGIFCDGVPELMTLLHMLRKVALGPYRGSIFRGSPNSSLV